ncbi:MAG: YolD-like family protein [Atopobiaceae bacterium]|nr:YolD-like family protein [Atopobiaceae bacterium]
MPERGGEGARRADGGPRADRAQQFMPFAALRGYYDLVRERERVVEPRHELTDEQAAALSRRMLRVRKGQMVAVTHYAGDAYVTTRGLCTAVDLTFRSITVVKERILFDDIVDVR